MTHVELKKRRQEVAASVAAGQTVAAAAAHYGIAVGTVREACHEAGTPAPDGRMQTVYCIVADLCRTADPLRAIAARHHLTPQRIGQVYRASLAAGIPVQLRKLGRCKNP